MTGTQEPHTFDENIRAMGLALARVSVAFALHSPGFPIFSDPTPFPEINMGWLRHSRYLV